MKVMEDNNELIQHENYRKQLWIDVFKITFEKVSREHNFNYAKIIADNAVQEFDDKFPINKTQ